MAIDATGLTEEQKQVLDAFERAREICREGRAHEMAPSGLEWAHELNILFCQLPARLLFPDEGEPQVTLPRDEQRGYYFAVARKYLAQVRQEQNYPALADFGSAMWHLKYTVRNFLGASWEGLEVSPEEIDEWDLFGDDMAGPGASANSADWFEPDQSQFYYGY